MDDIKSLASSLSDIIRHIIDKDAFFGALTQFPEQELKEQGIRLSNTYLSGEYQGVKPAQEFILILHLRKSLPRPIAQSSQPLPITFNYLRIL